VVGWTADGARLRAHHFEPGLARRFYLLDPSTGRAEPWITIGDRVDPAGVTSINRVYFSADGETYVYGLRRELSTLYVVDGVN
jgi:hypothetical protein